MNDLPIPHAASVEDHHLVEQFAFHEAALLDHRRYRDWLALITDDILYRVSVQWIRDAAETNPEVWIVDEDLTQLKLRAEQIAAPRLTHAENPATLTQRFVTNIRVAHGANPAEYSVDANLLVYVNRSGALNGAVYAGERRDVLRRVDGRLRIARRHVRLAHSIVHGGPVSTLF
jgi:3-phenylpropionate/cinnamic acid dioxygenase small subunit